MDAEVVLALFPYSLSLEPRENMPGVTAREPPLCSILCPHFQAAEALGLQEFLWKAGQKLSTLNYWG